MHCSFLHQSNVKTAKFDCLDLSGPPCIEYLFSYREERCYVSGKLDGTAKYFYSSGAVETRIYETGILQGMAVKQTTDGECEDRTYVNGKLEGQATVIFPDGSKEMRYGQYMTMYVWQRVAKDGKGWQRVKKGGKGWKRVAKGGKG